MSSRPEQTLRGPSRNARLTRSALILVALAALAIYTAKFPRGSGLQTSARSADPIARAPRHSIVEHAVDDAAGGLSGEHFSYIGSWEHVQAVRDGRSNGTSSRSYRAGSMATIHFEGERFTLYGITGITGGRGEMLVDGIPAGTASFYSPQKSTGVSVFTSRTLPEGTHTVTIVVLPQGRGEADRRFVNIDGATIGR